MALQTTTTIKIGQIIITNFAHLKVVQKIHDHHTFSLEVRQDLLVEEFKSVMPVSQQLYGERISIEIKPIDGLNDPLVLADSKNYVMQFYGIVTGVSMKKSCIDDIEESFLIEGYSTSFLLENAPESNSFTAMTLSDIVNRVKTGYDIDMQVRPFYDEIIPYTVQYNESCFAFLNRLAMRYGQYFYDNGRVLIFGDSAGAATQPNLIYGVNMHEFRYSIKLMPTSFTVIENDNRTGSYSIENTIDYRKELDGFHQNFINKSNVVYSKKTLMQLNQNAVGANGSATGAVYAQNKMRAVLSRLMEITASSEVPGVTVGNTVKIGGVDKQQESAYRVTEIVHACDDGGSYENHFKAVNTSDSAFSPNTNPDLIPYCGSQTAVVIANADPDGLSAVKVQMPWQKIKGGTTPYIPLVQEYSGNGRGRHILPEIGDTVFVDFQGNNAELPIVVGTMTSRKEKSGYGTENNDIKAVRTRSGIENISNDAEGSWKQSTPDGNFLSFDGKGNAVLNVPNKLIVNATDMEFNSFNNLEMNVSNNVIMNVMSRFFIYTPFMKQVVSGLMSLFSGKALINSKETINIEAEEVTTFGSEKMLVHSDKLTTINSMKVAEMHGKTKNSLTNKPKPQKKKTIENITNVLVEFRTKQSGYNGEFGFDWLRIDDNGATAEKPYFDCIENGYEAPNGSDTNTEYENRTEAFEHLEKEYLQIPINRSSNPNLKKYYIPWLNLYPESATIGVNPTPPCEAELRVLVDVEIEEPDQIRIIFDKKYFSINGNDGTDANPVLIANKTLGAKRDIGANIKIKCLGEFSSRQEITVYAYPKKSLLKTPAEQMTLRKIAGKIVLEPNSNAHAVKNRKKLKILLVQLKTNVSGVVGADIIRNINPVEKENLSKALHQSLIHAELIDYINSSGVMELDLTGDPNFRMSGKYIDPSNGLIIRTEPTLNSYLRQLVNQATSNRYVGSFYVFAFGIQDSTQNVGGRVEDIGKKSVVLYRGRDNYTLNHEVLHGLGLFHTHRNGTITDYRQQYVFKHADIDPLYATDNIMSYQPDGKTTWHWQWEIIKKNAQ